MKKQVILALSVIAMCILTGCANVDITITPKGNLLRDLEKANTYTEIYEKNGSFRVDVFGTHADGTKDDYSVYYEGDTYVSVNKYGTEIDDHGDVYGFDTEQDTPFKYLFFGDAYETYRNTYEMGANFAYFDSEKIVSREEKEGKLFLNTESPTEALRYNLESWGFDPDTVEKVVTEYIIDSDSLLIEDTKAYAVVDGKKNLYSDTVLVLDSDEFVPDKIITDAITSTDTRTITVIADPGTADEKEYKETIKKGGVVFIQVPSGYDGTLYDDSECTVVHAPVPDKNSDSTVYVKRDANAQ